MDDLKKELTEIEDRMQQADFWANKEEAQAVIKRYEEVKEELAGGGKHDKSNAIITIFSGAGGDDAEDFSRILLEMYFKYVEKQGWQIIPMHANENDHGGYRNVTFLVEGKNAYGILRNESGVHRLVRLSPFNSKKQRHTSFSLVEVIPEFKKTKNIDIPDDDLEIEFSKSSGPGGQNVNKRETAVRIVHNPTGISASSDSERTQLANKEKALALLEGKLYRRAEEVRLEKEKNLYVSKTTDNEWGSQIRSYVLHPYKLVKDHRTEVEVRDIEAVLDGQLDEFIEAEKDL